MADVSRVLLEEHHRGACGRSVGCAQEPRVQLGAVRGHQFGVVARQLVVFRTRHVLPRRTWQHGHVQQLPLQRHQHRHAAHAQPACGHGQRTQHADAFPGRFGRACGHGHDLGGFGDMDLTPIRQGKDPCPCPTQEGIGMRMERATIHASSSRKGREQADGAGPALVDTKGRTNMYIAQSNTNKQMHHGKKNTKKRGEPSRPPLTSIARKDAPPTEKGSSPSPNDGRKPSQGSYARDPPVPSLLSYPWGPECRTGGIVQMLHPTKVVRGNGPCILALHGRFLDRWGNPSGLAFFHLNRALGRVLGTFLLLFGKQALQPFLGMVSSASV
eukprot:scaffold598_cov318-Pavlova_lutheri.AAC.11